MELALAQSAPLSDVARYVTDDGWAAEQKLDGHRVLLTPDGPMGRNGPYTKGLPRGLAVPEGPWALDGELVEGAYWAFDLIVSDPLPGNLPLAERRPMLEAFVERLSNPLIHLVPQAVGQEAKSDLLLRAAREGAEGVVFKRLAARYRSGRTGDWAKVKFVMTADVIVSSVRDDGKESAGLSILRNGVLIEVGRCSLIGRPHLEVGDVIEVKYLYINDLDAPRLVQPVMLRKRDDKRPDQCDGSDLRVTSRAVLT